MNNKELFKLKLMMMKGDITESIKSVESDLAIDGLRVDRDQQPLDREKSRVLKGLGIGAKQELGKINRALTRIDRDEYFNCSLCNEEIPIERLELLPYSLYCVNCAEKLEH